MRVLLESHGFLVEDYGNPREFLEQVPSGDGTCLLLDLYMTEMDGVEVLTALRRQGSALPVIVISGRAESPAGGRALKAGANILLSKPVEERILLESIQAVCEAELAAGNPGFVAGNQARPGQAVRIRP